MAGFDHLLEPDVDAELETRDDSARLTVTADLEPGQRLRLTKFVAYGWSAERSARALQGEVAAALTAARETGWDRLAADQGDDLGEFWSRADVEVDGDPAVQQAIRFGLFHLLQASVRAEQRALPAKG